MQKILIAEDDESSAKLLAFHLQKAGYSYEISRNGLEARQAMAKRNFDILLTDWMMPEMDGIQLIRTVRKEVKNIPLIIMITAITSPEARYFALDSGADDFITKPYNGAQLLDALTNLQRRSQQRRPEITVGERPQPAQPAPFTGVLIASSTGGPEALRALFRNYQPSPRAAYFLVQHGPKWMLETFAARLQEDFRIPIELAQKGTRPQAGKAYLAPGDFHMIFKPNPLTLDLVDTPPENFVKPAADPTFRSAAEVFGRNCIGIVLTGMGNDGIRGASHIKSVGGKLLAQDPATAVVKSMPQGLVNAGLAPQIHTLQEMGAAINNLVHTLSPK